MTNETAKPVIEVQALDKRFEQIHAVQGVSFNVNQGEVLGFLGPNGAGKSTTMKMIAGFLEPTSGTVVVCGNDVLEEPIKVKQVIGYLPEGAPLYAEMTVYRFLDFVADIRGLKGNDKKKRIDETIKIINIESVVNQTI